MVGIDVTAEPSGTVRRPTWPDPSQGDHNDKRRTSLRATWRVHAESRPRSSARRNASGSSRLTYKVLREIGQTPSSHARCDTRRSTWTIPLDDPFTSHRPRYPCAPQPPTMSAWRRALASADRAISERKSQPRCTSRDRGPSATTSRLGAAPSTENRPWNSGSTRMANRAGWVGWGTSSGTCPR